MQSQESQSFPKATSFDATLVRSKIMGPNPLKLCEELLRGARIPRGARVCDLGSGTGITSALLAREYGFDTYAVDLWSDPEENRAFFDSLGIPRNTIHPVKADASQGLPFEHDFFDAVVSIDSYNYYGRDPHYLGGRLLPYVKQGGMLYRSIPGMVRDCHDNLPDCLLKSWTPEQLDYMHDIAWWRAMIEPTAGPTTGIALAAITGALPAREMPCSVSQRGAGAKPAAAFACASFASRATAPPLKRARLNTSTPSQSC